MIKFIQEFNGQNVSRENPVNPFDLLRPTTHFSWGSSPKKNFNHLSHFM